ncbi:hypothetical protein [Flavobacterium sp. W22_SRS_FP1]
MKEIKNKKGVVSLFEVGLLQKQKKTEFTSFTHPIWFSGACLPMYY